MATAASVPDEEILERVRGGDTASYESIMRRYNQRLFRVARAILKSDTDAEDAVQNAYIQAYLHLGQFEGEAAFSTWLTRIAIREAYLLLRRSRLYASGDMESMFDSSRSDEDPERDVLRFEMRTLIEQAANRLPLKYRLVFMLRDVEELSTAETARCLNISGKNVKVRLHRARAFLRRELYAAAGHTLKEVFAFDGIRCDRIVESVLSTLSHSDPSRQQPLGW
jgi:RNA polymerase sigma-70 factor (ECF subfamily)